MMIGLTNFYRFQKLKIMEVDAAAEEIGISRHKIQFTETITMREFGAISRTTDKIGNLLKSRLTDMPIEIASENDVNVDNGRITIKVLPVPKSDTEREVFITWGIQVIYVHVFRAYIH